MSIGDRTTTRCTRRAIAVTLAAALVALLAASVVSAGRKAGEGTVRGTVTSIADEPLAGVEITLEAADGTRTTATTDKRGKFSLKVPAGEYAITLKRAGYAPFESPLSVAAGGRQVVTAQLLDVAAGRRSAAAQAFNAAVDALEDGDKAAAKAGLLAAVEADPTLLEPHGVLAEIYLDEGSWAAAAAAAETWLAENPQDRPVRLIAYEAYRGMKNATRVAEMRRSLGTDPELAPKLAVHAFNEGAVADRGGDPATAAARFREALELDGGLAAAHFALATLEYRARRYDEALIALAGGLALEPASARGRRLAFLVADAKDDPERVAAALAAYAEVDAEGAADLLFQRGELDFRNGEVEPARRALSRVVELRPDHAGAHHLLGLAWVTGDTELAKSHLRRFLELAPEDPEAAAAREILANLE